MASVLRNYPVRLKLSLFCHTHRYKIHRFYGEKDTEIVVSGTLPVALILVHIRKALATHSELELIHIAYYSGRRAARVKISVALSNSFRRDGPSNKTLGHELLLSVSFFVLG